MALTDARRLVLVAAACAMIWVGIIYRPIGLGMLPPRRIPPPRNPVAIAAAALGRANDRWRLLELRDSIVALAPKAADGVPTIIIDPSLPADVRQRLDKAVSSQWKALVPQTALSVTLAIVVDTAQSPHGHIRPFHFAGSIPIDVFLPTTATHGACVSLAHLAGGFKNVTQLAGDARSARMQNILMQDLLTSETISSLLDPCALIAAFGNPGPHVAEWLRGGGWGEARFANWDAPASPWKAVISPDAGPTKPLGWLNGLGDATWHIRGYVAPPGIACLAGESGSCANILLDYRRSTLDSVWRSSVVSSAGTNAMSFFLPSAAAPLGPAAGSLVSEMVRTLGRERFARFWHSSLPIDSAFYDASGRSLDNWVRDWGVYMYGRAAVGPTVSGVGLATGAIILVLALAAAIGVERRRRVV
jgi:hypothetical protein